MVITYDAVYTWTMDPRKSIVIGYIIIKLCLIYCNGKVGINSKLTDNKRNKI